MAEEPFSLNAFRLNSQGDITIGEISIGEITGRDKIVNNIQNIYQHVQSAAEAAAQARALEIQLLAEGIGAFATRLQARLNEGADSSRPYRGLLEYRLNDAGLFYGRSRAIYELLQHLGSGSLTVLHSESGAGKTSLLQAGIAPHLIAASHLPVYLRPYDLSPALALKRAFVSDLREAPTLASAPLHQFLRQAAAVLGAHAKLLIMLDQFEEFFTLVPEPARDAFIGELASCIDDASLNVRWVVALRSEYFANLATFRPRIRNPFANDYRLSRLTRPEAQAVIVEPAKRRGLQFEDGLVETLLDDLGGSDVAPPQIQLVCSALYEELAPGAQTMSRAIYDREGGAAGILRGHLGRVLGRDLPLLYRSTARRVLEALTTSEPRRIVRSHNDLLADLAIWGASPDQVAATIDQLVNSRLLRVHEAEQGLAYELAHDYLLDEIKLDPELQARKAVQELLEQEVRAFTQFKTLLTADRLAIIEPHRTDLRLNAAAAQLLDESRAAVRRQQDEAEAQQQRELRTLRRLAQAQQAQPKDTPQTRLATLAVSLAGFCGLLLILAFASVLMGETFGQTVLNVLSCVSVPTVFLVLLAALGAFRSAKGIEPLPGAEFSPANDRLVTVSYGTVRLWDMDGRHIASIYQSGAQAAAFSPDGTRVLITCEGPRALIWDPATNQTIPLDTGSFPRLKSPVRVSGSYSPDGLTILTTLQGGYSHLWDISGRLRRTLRDSSYGVFSPDGRSIATISLDNKARLWTAEGDILAILEGHGGAISAVSFSPDSAWLATASEDGTARVWTLEGEMVAELKGHTAAVVAVSFSPDCSRVITASSDHTARLWERTGALVKILDEHTQKLTCAVYSPDGTQILTSSTDGMILVWSASGRFQSQLSHEFRSSSLLLRVRYSWDGQRIVAVNSGEGFLWDRAGHYISGLHTAAEQTSGGSGGA